MLLCVYVCVTGQTKILYPNNPKFWPITNPNLDSGMWWISTYLLVCLHPSLSIRAILNVYVFSKRLKPAYCNATHFTEVTNQECIVMLIKEMLKIVIRLQENGLPCLLPKRDCDLIT